MHILIGLFYVWLGLLAVFFAVGLPVLLLIVGIAKLGDAVTERTHARAQARQQAWERKMLATEWGKEILAAREQRARD